MNKEKVNKHKLVLWKDKIDKTLTKLIKEKKEIKHKLCILGICSVMEGAIILLGWTQILLK